MFDGSRHVLLSRPLRRLAISAAGCALAVVPVFSTDTLSVAVADPDDGPDSDDAAPQSAQDPCAAQRAAFSRAQTQAQMFNMSRFFVNGQSEGAMERSNQFGEDVAQRVEKAQEDLESCYAKASSAPDNETSDDQAERDPE